MKSNTGIFLTLFVITVLSACSSNEIGESKDVSQDKIYQSYSIEQNGNNNEVTITCQFRFAGKNGTTLVLNNPSKIVFDNEALKVDSNSTAGAYYAINKSADGFLGNHSFVFTDVNNKKFENNLVFDNFSLVNEVAGATKNIPLEIHFDAGKLSTGDHVELYTTDSDSSFSISYVAGTDAGNVFIIPVKELQRQKTTMLSLEAAVDKVIPLQQASIEGGIIRVSQKSKEIKIKLKD